MNATPRIIALLYHRIDENNTDPWGICVSPEHFDEQLQVVKKYLPVITANDAAQQVMNNKIAEISTCITFDDGYEDNYTNALPILKQHHCPATFFIATAFIESQIPFWWDELEMICLRSKQLPAHLELVVDNTVHSFSFETELNQINWQQHASWKWYEDAPTLRCRSFLAIWNLLRPLPYFVIEKLMNQVRIWSGNHFQTRLPMSKAQLQYLGAEELATIGLHTHTHLDLVSHSTSIQIDDTEENQRVLAGQFGIDGSLLAFPYGRYNDSTISAVNKMNLSGCFTTEAQPITAASDVKRLGRYQVGDWNAQEFEEQLKSWISV